MIAVKQQTCFGSNRPGPLPSSYTMVSVKAHPGSGFWFDRPVFSLCFLVPFIFPVLWYAFTIRIIVSTFEYLFAWIVSRDLQQEITRLQVRPRFPRVVLRWCNHSNNEDQNEDIKIHNHGGGGGDHDKVGTISSKPFHCTRYLHANRESEQNEQELE